MAFGDPFYNRDALPRELQPTKSAIEELEDMKSRSEPERKAEPKPEAGPKEKPKEILSPESIRKQMRHEMINNIYNQLRIRGLYTSYSINRNPAARCRMLHDIAQAFKDKGYYVKESYQGASYFTVEIQIEPFDTPPFTLPEAHRGAE